MKKWKQVVVEAFKNVHDLWNQANIPMPLLRKLTQLETDIIEQASPFDGIHVGEPFSSFEDYE
jgi:hypothetical protein